MAVCIAVIGKDNSPKYIKCADESLALQFHCKVHTSIDVIEEKLNVGNKTAVDIRDLYLGLLYTTEEYKIYGYATNTKIKFIIVLPSSNVAQRENDIKMIFKKLHAAYCNAVCNPFYIPGDQINSNNGNNGYYIASFLINVLKREANLRELCVEEELRKQIV